jgi:hypothetical protein
MLDPGMIIAVLVFISATATAVHDAINRALDSELVFEHKERQLLKRLCKAVESLKSDKNVYRTLMNTMDSDTGLNGRSPYSRLIQRCAIGLRSTS